MDVAVWLRELGLERYVEAFEANDIDVAVLRSLNADELKELGVASLGHRKRLLEAIAALGGEPSEAAVAAPESTPAVPDKVRPDAERRQLTVLFCDLVGSTALSGRLDPEDMREVIRAYQNAVAGEIGRFEGHVAKFMGDGVLAYFGYPQAHEDEAERAVRAGLALAATVAKLEAPTGDLLAARVGIATGLVVVGDLVGEGAAQEQAVVGETPNLAARLQEIATPGQVVIAASTCRLLGAGFDLKDLGKRELKGIKEPAAAFAVKGERPVESRFEAMSGPSLLPMVGRDQELALLLERWALAKAGEGQGVLLVGEAGIGKSRIVRALADALANTSQRTLRYQCSPYHTDSPLWPVAQHVAHAACIAVEDDARTRVAKLQEVLAESGVTSPDALALLAHVIGLDDPESSALAELTPQQRRLRTFALLLDQLLGLARQTPLLVMFEDIHWIDPTSLELLEQALDRIASARVLLLLTTRPDNQPALGGHPHLTRLTLNRLARGSSAVIMDRLARGKPLPSEVSAQILARTDGVPLFVEELTKGVLESGMLREMTDAWILDRALPAAAIPASLHDSLMARLDRLAPVREVAQVAACIGREFDHRLLATVVGVDARDLTGALGELTRAELVFRRGAPPDASFVFKHALVRDAAYESLLKDRRRAVHARIVEALEQDRPDTPPEVLAQHCADAGLREKAAGLWILAGRRANQRSAAGEAVSQLQKGLAALVDLPDTPKRQDLELDLQITLGAALIAAKSYAAPETGAAFDRARQLAEELGEAERLMPVLYGQTLFHMDAGRRPAALATAQRLLTLGGDLDTAALLAHRLIAACCVHMGRFREAVDHGHIALRLYDLERHDELRFRYAQDQLVSVLGHICRAELPMGMVSAGLDHIEEGIARARRLAHPHTLAFVLHCATCLYQIARIGDRLMQVGTEQIELCDRHGFTFHRCAGVAAFGAAHRLAGDHARAVELLQAALVGFRGAHAGYLLPTWLGELAQALSAQGRATEGLAAVREALRYVEVNEERSDEAPLLVIEGELLLQAPGADLAAAETCMEAGLAAARAQGARLYELRAATSLARLWAERGKGGQAREILAPIYGWFTEGFDTADLEDARTLLEELR
jgi:class 3 adenylate cyclase/ABC-type transport system involved in cytochrome c biogenesis ATPase subunit/tetratricopeptide (TPR) repeat protein